MAFAEPVQVLPVLMTPSPYTSMQCQAEQGNNPAFRAQSGSWRRSGRVLPRNIMAGLLLCHQPKNAVEILLLHERYVEG